MFGSWAEQNHPRLEAFPARGEAFPRDSDLMRYLSLENVGQHSRANNACPRSGVPRELVAKKVHFIDFADSRKGTAGLQCMQ